MNIIEYIDIISRKLKESKDDNNTNEFLRLLEILRDTIDEQLKKFKGVG